jgi:hypothetical protein
MAFFTPLSLNVGLKREASLRKAKKLLGQDSYKINIKFYIYRSVIK